MFQMLTHLRMFGVLDPRILEVGISAHPTVKPAIVHVWTNTASTTGPGGTHYLVQENTSPVHDFLAFVIFGSKSLDIFECCKFKLEWHPKD